MKNGNTAKKSEQRGKIWQFDSFTKEDNAEISAIVPMREKPLKVKETGNNPNVNKDGTPNVRSPCTTSTRRRIVCTSHDTGKIGKPAREWPLHQIQISPAEAGAFEG